MPAYDPYPYPPLAKLLPSDPDPEPFDEPAADELPTIETLPFVPTVTATLTRSFRDSERFTFQQLWYSVGTVSLGSRIYTEFERFTFAEVVTFTDSNGFATFELLPLSIFRDFEQYTFEQVEVSPGLFAHWILDGDPYLEEIDGYDLTATGTVNEFFDVGENTIVPEFGNYITVQYNEFSEQYEALYDFSGYLARTATASDFDMMPTGGRWSWRVTFDLWMEPRQIITDTATGTTGDDPDAYLNAQSFDTIFQIATSSSPQAICYVQNFNVPNPLDNEVRLYFRSYAEFDNNGVESSVVLQPRQWYAIECEFDGVSRDQIIRVDGVAATANMFAQWYDPVADDFTPWHPNDGSYNAAEFQIGTANISNFRIKEFKFYKTEFHPRP